MAAVREADMLTGWQRLGVVLSVLWAVAGPLWFVSRENTRINNSFESCLAVTHLANSIALQEKMADDCSRTASALATSVPQLMADDNGKKILAWVVGGPIVILWLLGWMLIGTTQWVARGFR
jgi:hypothetical protein